MAGKHAQNRCGNFAVWQMNLSCSSCENLLNGKHSFFCCNKSFARETVWTFVVASQHAKRQRLAPRQHVEEGLFLRRVALQRRYIPPGHIEFAILVEAHFADPAQPFPNQAAVPARHTANAFPFGVPQFPDARHAVEIFSQRLVGYFRFACHRSASTGSHTCLFMSYCSTFCRGFHTFWCIIGAKVHKSIDVLTTFHILFTYNNTDAKGIDGDELRHQRTSQGAKVVTGSLRVVPVQRSLPSRPVNGSQCPVAGSGGSPLSEHPIARQALLGVSGLLRQARRVVPRANARPFKGASVFVCAPQNAR